MIITSIFRGNFLDRPNRFTVRFKSGFKTENAHLRDPGRLKELLSPNSVLLLRPAVNIANRKTKYDVIAVSNINRWVLINSGFHSDLAAELIQSGILSELKGYSIDKREFAYGRSRIDFLLTAADDEGDNSVDNGRFNKLLLEVKGCTLVENGWAKFPDAPTERGKRHIEELIKAKREGMGALVLFLITRDDALLFSPNWEMDFNFSKALSQAADEGVKVIAYSFKITLKKDILKISPFKQVNIRI